ncbi:MAG: hypothetical protein PUB00_09175, partial [Clostridiales bacterium]|nr:hypothetical protein [Clostridiales bacterium]
MPARRVPPLRWKYQIPGHHLACPIFLNISLLHQLTYLLQTAGGSVSFSAGKMSSTAFQSKMSQPYFSIVMLKKQEKKEKRKIILRGAIFDKIRGFV